MGRGILNMELIPNEKSRMTTFKKRKKGLMKKAYEFKKLCDVNTCVIIYGPKKKEGSVELETYPNEHDGVMETINKFKFKCKDSDVYKRKTLSDFFELRKKKVDVEICKLRNANREARFPSWDDRFNVLSFEQLRVLNATFDSKLQAAKTMLTVMKGDQFMMEDSKSGTSLCGFNTQFKHSITNSYMGFEVYNQQPISSSMKPFNAHLPTYNSQMLPFDRNPVFDPTMMLMMNANDYTQYGGGMSRSNIPYTQLKPAYYDPTAAMPENDIYNPRLLPMCNYGPATQPTAPYGQQLIPNVSPHLNVSQLMSEFVRKYERERFQT